MSQLDQVMRDTDVSPPKTASTPKTVSIPKTDGEVVIVFEEASPQDIPLSGGTDGPLAD